jgi:hypothetical protein
LVKKLIENRAGLSEGSPLVFAGSSRAGGRIKQIEDFGVLFGFFLICSIKKLQDGL